MISEERLKELIKQEATIYKIVENKVIEVVCIQVPKNIQNLYETEEEAEWVAQNWCEKTIKFEPPTFEEFKKIKTSFRKPDKLWKCQDINITDNEYINEFKVYKDYSVAKCFGYNNKTGIKKQAYYQAVEYAKKLFLGEDV